MKRQQFQRRVYEGAEVGGFYTITAIKFAPFKEGETFRKHGVSNIAEYESGCHQHKHCFGHMCETPSGCVLLPQSMSMRTMEISTQYHAASKLAFSGNVEEYVEALKHTNYTKDGTYRVVMSTPVAGSMRLIATPQWEFGKEYIAVSYNLASRMKVCKKVYDNNGNVGGRYVESDLKENDWVIVVRPPSLHFGNTQPMRVKFWNKDVIGIHPESFSLFHGDFDGDEAHMYPVFDVGSIMECEAWEVLPLTSFQVGRQRLKEVGPKLDLNLQSADMEDNGLAEFIEYTTLSAKQLKEKRQRLAFGEYSRNKDEYLLGMYDRFNSSHTAASFVEDCIRGTEHVKEQQLSQGNLGDMTRVAKIAISCFYRPHSGSLCVKCRDGESVLVKDKKTDPGTPSVRAVMALCASAQQAKLNAHRVRTSEDAAISTNHDFISDLILGCSRKVHISETSSYTFVQCRTSAALSEMSASVPTLNVLDIYCTLCKPVWKYVDRDKGRVSMLCRPEDVKGDVINYVHAAYNPLVLHTIESKMQHVAEVCRRGITMVCNYYKIAISDIELHDLSEAYSYLPGASEHPVTTRKGMIARNLGWIETFQATDYTKLPSLESEFETPDTTTGAMFVSNFSNLKVKY